MMTVMGILCGLNAAMATGAMGYPFLWLVVLFGATGWLLDNQVLALKLQRPVEHPAKQLYEFAPPETSPQPTEPAATASLSRAA